MVANWLMMWEGAMRKLYQGTFKNEKRRILKVNSRSRKKASMPGVERTVVGRVNDQTGEVCSYRALQDKFL